MTKTKPDDERSFVKFDPTFNTGTIATIVTILASAVTVYTGFKTDQVKQQAELDQVKAVAIVERAQTTQALAEIKLEMKEQGKTLGDLKEGIAILRGRAAEPGSKR